MPLPTVLAVSAMGPGDPPAPGQQVIVTPQQTFRDKNVTITLQDVSYSVKDSRPGPDKGKQLHLLKGVNAYFEPGKMSALMGPSGSGKTTLLDLLSGRKTVGTLEGAIEFSGIKPTKEYLRRYTGMVEQFDTLLPIFTPYEMLMYTAELKRPLSEPLDRKRASVEDILATLALDTCRSVKIGSPMARGLSGGQLKRTNIGIALITNPRVLFLDEPTTGLDSFTANEVMGVVKKLTAQGVNVVATIHSPTAYAFSLFDSLLMLVGGQTVYFGPQGPTAVNFFKTSCPHIKEYVQGYNDAEYLVDLITEADRFGRGPEFASAYASSSLAADCTAELNRLHAHKEVVPAALLKELQVSRATVTPWWWGLWVFFKYRTTKNYRDPGFLAPRIFDKGIIAILVMTLYLGVGDDFSNRNLINIVAILYMWIGGTGFSAISYVPALFLERPLFVRERSDGLYLPITYLIARMFDELLINSLASCGIAAFTFYGVQLQGEFILFWVSYFSCVASGIILAYLVAAVAPSMDGANAILSLYGILLLFFTGFLIRLPAMPPWYKWISYITFTRYAFGANLINQFEDNDPVYIDGQTVLQYYGYDGVKGKWTNVGFTALHFIFFFACTWATLHFRRFAIR